MRASQFVLHRIRRLPVVREGKLVGVISRRDLLRHIAEQASHNQDFVDHMQSVVAQ